MENIKDLLDEYCELNNKINILKNKINDLKKETHIKLSLAVTENDKTKILENFKKEINDFKNNKVIKEEYKNLKEKKDKIYYKLINLSSKSKINIDNSNLNIKNEINSLINKYN